MKSGWVLHISWTVKPVYLYSALASHTTNGEQRKSGSTVASILIRSSTLASTELTVEVKVRYSCNAVAPRTEKGFSCDPESRYSDIYSKMYPRRLLSYQCCPLKAVRALSATGQHTSRRHVSRHFSSSSRTESDRTVAILHQNTNGVNTTLKLALDDGKYNSLLFPVDVKLTVERSTAGISVSLATWELPEQLEPRHLSTICQSSNATRA